MHAVLVASGIFLSRVLGLVRQSLMARYLGATGTPAADAFNAAFRIPNFLNNLFGEGALSASFIPVYSRLLAKDDPREADRVAGAVGAFLALITAVLVLVGVTLAPMIVSIIVPGLDAERRALTIQLTRILFPGAALFVFSAWCLGILNSHRRFFLSYAAPVAWNAVLIGALLWYGGESPVSLSVKLAWASVVGAALQFLVQLPVVVRVAPAVRLVIARGNESVRTVIRNFTPAVVARGVVQVSAFVDQAIASFLGTGAIALLAYAQSITILPVSLFGMAISASELPEMSRAIGAEQEVARQIHARLDQSLRRIAFFVVPSAAAFAVLGDVIAAALFQHGLFSAADTRFTWGILAAASVGLLASTLGRLYSSAFYALHDTRTPLKFAVLRVSLASGLGFLAAMYVPEMLGVDSRWGAAALTLTSGVVGWVEFALLRAHLNRRVGATGLTQRLLLALWASALLAAAAGFGVKVALAGTHRIALAVAALGTMGVVYLALAGAFGVAESGELLRRARNALGMGGRKE